MDEQKEKVGIGRNDLRTAVRERTVGYVVAAFSVVAGLAWNEAVKALIEHIFPLGQNTLSAKFVYALFVTLVAVVLTVYLAKLFRKDAE